MRLYHGTTERHLESILRDGLRPRGSANGGNWEAYPSRPDMVYLTTAYPLYFAAANANEGERLLILELELGELDDTRLYPDEDAVAQSISHRESRPLAEVQHEVVVNLEGWQDNWAHALKAMGTVAHQGTIDPETIRQAVLIDPDARMSPWLFMTMLDPTITILNYKVKGTFYTQLTEWAIGARDTIPGGTAMEMEALRGMDPEFAAKREAMLEAEARDRSGIEIISKESWLEKVNSLKRVGDSSRKVGGNT